MNAKVKTVPQEECDTRLIDIVALLQDDIEHNARIRKLEAAEYGRALLESLKRGYHVGMARKR